MDSSNITAPLAFFAGSLSFLSPCVLPLVPGYLSTVSAVYSSGISCPRHTPQPR